MNPLAVKIENEARRNIMGCWLSIAANVAVFLMWAFVVSGPLRWIALLNVVLAAVEWELIKKSRRIIRECERFH